jgi:hypothetical protein
LSRFVGSPAMDPDNALIHVLTIILRECWKLPVNQQAAELDRCATVLLKRIRAGDGYGSLHSYVIQLRNSVGVRTLNNHGDTEIADRVVALVKNVR